MIKCPEDAKKVYVNILFINDVKTYCKSSSIFGLYFLHYCALYNYKPHLNGNDGTQKRPFRRIGCSPKTGKYGIPILFIFCAEAYIIQNIEIYLFFTKKKNGKAVNKFDFLLLPIFYIGNVSFIVTATWLILLKAQFYYRLY